MSAPGGQTGDSSRISELVSALRQHDAITPRQAREQLVNIGEGAVPQLVTALQDDDTQMRWEATKALSEIGSPRSASALVAGLRDNDGGVRWLAADALIGIGAPALPAVLHGLINGAESPVVREGVHHVLSGFARNKQLGPQVQPILTALDGQAPEVACLVPAENLLKQLGG